MSVILTMEKINQFMIFYGTEAVLRLECREFSKISFSDFNDEDSAKLFIELAD